jgi:hypothetical protein
MISQLSLPYSSHYTSRQKRSIKPVGVQSNYRVYHDCACVRVFISSLFLFTSFVNTTKHSGYYMYQLQHKKICIFCPKNVFMCSVSYSEQISIYL